MFKDVSQLVSIPCVDLPFDLFFACSISTVTKLLGRIYYYDPASGRPGNLPANVSLSVNLVALCGTLAGQVTILPFLVVRVGRMS